MNHIFLIEAMEMKNVAKMGIKEAQEQMMLCSQELDQPLPPSEAEEIISQMMEIQTHQDICESALKTINSFIKENRYLLN
jgi:protein subunit release factor A